MPAMTDPGGLIHAFVLDGQGGGEPLDWDGIERWQPAHGVLWVNLDYQGQDSQAWLGMRSGVDPVIRDALLDRDPRPRALAVGDSLLLILRGINLNQGAEPEDMVSVRCWIEPGRIITMRHRPVRVLKTIAADLQRGAGPRTPGQFVREVAERALEPVVTVVDGIDDAVARAEDDALADAPPTKLRAQLADLRRRAIALRRFVAPQREAFNRLGATTLPWLGEEERARLREAEGRLTRTVEELDAARDRASVTHEEMASRIGEITNQRLYVLSILSAIFLPLGFLADVLGVSVGGVPGKETSWAFWAMCAAFALGGWVQLWLFRRYKWIGDNRPDRQKPD